MFWLILIVILILLIGFISLFLPLVCQLAIQVSDEIHLELTFRLVNFSIYSKTDQLTFDSLIDDHIQPMLSKKNASKFNQLKIIKLQQFKWHSIIGLEHADETAMSVSGLLMLKGLISQIIFQILNDPKVFHYQVHPNYNELTFQSDCQCIFSLRLWQAIYMKIKR